MSPRVLYSLFASLLLAVVACAPKAEVAATPTRTVTGPPQAEVVARLTDIGPLPPDGRAGKPSVAEPQLVDVQPSGVASSSAVVTLKFSEAMDPTGPMPVVQLDPPVVGKLRWTDPYRLAFVPDAGVSDAHRYSVTASGSVRSRGGVETPVSAEWSFETPRPTVEMWSESSDGDGLAPEPIHWRNRFRVSVSHKVSAAALRRATEVFDVSGREPRRLEFGLKGIFNARGARTSRTWEVLPRGHWPADAVIEARVKDTLVTQAGPLPTGREVTRRLRTRPGLAVSLECEDQLPEGCPPGYVTLEFDAPVPRRYLSKIAISPKPRNLSIEHGYGDEEDKQMNYAFLFADFEPGETYSIRLKPGFKDIHGQPYAGPRVQKLRTIRPPPLLELSGDAVLLTAKKGTVGVESRLVEEASLSISSLEDEALVELLALEHDARYRPRHGAQTQHQTLDLSPGGTYGWDAREIDLEAELGAPHFAAFVQIEPTALADAAKGRTPVGSSQMLVQRTDLGAVFGRSPSSSFVRVASLRSAQPLADAEVTVFDTSTDPPSRAGTYGPTDSDGFVLLPAHDELPEAAVLVVRRGDDRFAMQVRERGWYRSSHERGEDYDVGVIMPDRNLYQPGERMRVMGWVAKSVADGGFGLSAAGTHPVEVKLTSGSKVLATRTVRAKPYGKFWATLQVPADAPLGTAKIEATLGTGERTTGFSTHVLLREFEAPAFDVKLSTPSADLVHDQSVTLSARAAYLHGMSLPIARAKLGTQCDTRTYRPVGRADYDVLEPLDTAPRWSARTTLPPTPEHERGVVETAVDLTRLQNGWTYRCDFSLGVQDAAWQEISTDTHVWVHPSHYVMVSPLASSRFVRGTEAVWNGVSVLSDGSTGPSDTATVEIQSLKYDAEGHFVSAKTVKHCPLEIDGETGGRCGWTPPKSGRYRAVIRATVDGAILGRSDDFSVFDPPVRRRSHRPARFSFWMRAPSNVELGDDVPVEIQSEEPETSGFVVDVHAGIRSLHPFETRDHRGTLTLHADDAWAPRTYLDAHVTRPLGPKGELPRAFKTSANVMMGVEHRALSVALENPAEATVRSNLPIEVRVTDLAGDAVPRAHVSVWAVDEGVLMLREWKFPDFPQALSTDRGNEATYFEDYDSLRYPYTKRGDPYEPGPGRLGGVGRGYGSGHGAAYGGRASVGRATSAIVRRNFDPAPIFVGDVVTDATGIARLEGTLPDNLTTFRIAAVATAEVGDTGAFARGGRAEGRVRVTQDLSVRALLPNVLRPGDTAELAALVDNLAGLRGDLDVAIELDDPHGALELMSDATAHRRKTDAPQQRVPFTVRARKPGTVRVRVSASLDAKGRTLRDASELTLEVIAERTLRHRAAVYGSFDEATPRAIELEPPAGAHALDASVDLYTSLLGGYADNVDALIQYPYGCVEQTSSQLIPLIALRQLEHYPLGVEDTDAFMSAGVQRLADMQLHSGAFGYWPGASTPHVYGTAYATWVLTRADAAGFTVDPHILGRATGYLRDELEHFGARGTPTTHQEIRAAMALHALAEAGHSLPEVRDALIDRAPSLPAFARVFLVLALHHEQPGDPRIAALLASVTDQLEERDSIARTRAEPVQYSRYFDSPQRTDAMLLLALAEVDPDSPWIEKLARGLSQARDAGAIRNTQENAYTLLAMAAYAELREQTPPALDVHTWLDRDPLLDVRFEGRDLSVHRARRTFEAGRMPRVTLDPKGDGRLYYRVGLGWTQSAVDTVSHAAGLAVTRRLFDEGGEYGPDRSLHAGDTAWLEVHVTADMRQRYVAIDVPLPAGVEAVDTSLGRTGPVLVPGGTRQGARPLHYNHNELRRDRVVVFVDQLDSGDHRFSVPVRATHEGTYSFPPTRAEAMYTPEVFGHSDGGSLRVGAAQR